MSNPITIAALAAVCALGVAGCEATVTPAEPVVARVAAVPADIWTFPHVVYGDSFAYLVDGTWYQQTPRGWVIYRREPPELARQRRAIHAAPGRRGSRSPAFGIPRR